jgi:predicted peptidase
MKKHLSVLLCMLILSFAAFTQGVQKLVTVQWGSHAGDTARGYLYLPKDYNQTTQNYPVVFAYHGKGEAGTNPAILLRQGVSYDLAHGNTPDSTVNPVDGKIYSFIILQLQAPSWSVNPGYLGGEIKWITKNFRVDTSRIYVTGLSAGGQCAMRTLCTADSVAKKIAAAVIMSPAGYTCNYTFIQKYQIPVWFLCGTSDTVVGPVPTITYYTNCFKATACKTHVTWHTGGHTGWIQKYAKEYRDPISGYSVWQWLLQYKTPTSGLTGILGTITPGVAEVLGTITK